MSIVSAALSAVRKSRLITAFLTVAAFVTISLDSARAEYPDHQVTIIACFPAGGGTDLAARMIHVQLGNALGQPVIIENRGGAGGSIGTGVVARAIEPTAIRCWPARAHSWSIRACTRKSPTIRSRTSSRSW